MQRLDELVNICCNFLYVLSILRISVILIYLYFFVSFSDLRWSSSCNNPI